MDATSDNIGSSSTFLSSLSPLALDDDDDDDAIPQMREK